MVRQLAAIEQNEGALLQSEYLNLVRLQVKFDLFESLKLHSELRNQSESRVKFIFKPQECVMQPKDSMGLEVGDVVVCALHPVIEKLDLEDLSPEQQKITIHRLLFQAVCAANPHSSTLFLGFARQSPFSSFVELKVSAVVG